MNRQIWTTKYVQTQKRWVPMILLLVLVTSFACLLYCESSSKDKASKPATPHLTSSPSPASPKPTSTPISTKRNIPPKTMEKPSLPENVSTDSSLVPDDYLEAAIRVAIDKPDGDLYLSDLELVTDLRLKWVQDLSGLEYCTNLTNLDLHGFTWGLPGYDSEGRQIGGTTHITFNFVTDILPLVQNPGLGEGDTVDLREQGLNSESREVYIPELESRGVKVLY